MKNAGVKSLSVVLILCMAIGIWVYSDVSHNNEITKISALPENKIGGDATKVLWALENDEVADFNEIFLECDYVDQRYDKSDFSMQTLLRLMYGYKDQLPDEVIERISRTFLDFKYWMDQPGEDGMCYWSENHQILFMSSEYLAGALLADELFTNDGKSGSDHRDMGKERVLTWLEQRWLYGFSEWYSNTYYKEDLMALSNLIEFSPDQEVVTKSKIIMDLLLYDVATQSYKGTFVVTSGRLYENNKKSGHGNRLNRVSEALFGFDLDAEDKNSGLDLNFIYMDNYKLPNVIELIGQDESNLIIKASNGLNVTELEDEGLLGMNDHQIMMQWAMEAFTNPEVIENSLEYIDQHNMYSNEFLYDFRLMNIELLKGISLLPVVSRVLNFKSNGVAIQRANTYTYKTDAYMLSTAQSHHPGGFADQQHIWSATLSNDVSVFTIHPASSPKSEGGASGTPNYWVGSGRLPHSVQDENINLSMYVIPDKKGFMEEELLAYTHAFFPSELLDEVVLDGRYIFGKVGNAYIAMIGYQEMEFRKDSSDDLLQKGQVTYWITELSSEYDESFDEFKERIYSNDIAFDFDQLHLTYKSNDKQLELLYNQNFEVNDQEVNTEYNRHDSIYSVSQRKAETMTIEFEGQTLFLDFYNQIRQEY